jgi:hypothetical protein
MGSELTDRNTQVAAADRLLTRALVILDAINETQAAAHVDLGLQRLRGSRITPTEPLASGDHLASGGKSYH